LRIAPGAICPLPATDYIVSRRYADSLAHKAALQRADDAQAAAAQADAQLAALRAALSPLQQRVSDALAAATRQSDAALKTLGEARTAQEQAQAHGAYALAQVRKDRWDAENDCWKEFAALEKAGSAFAHELADRARGVAGDRDVSDINQEEDLLRETLGTSEEYVRSLATMAQKTGWTH